MVVSSWLAMLWRDEKRVESAWIACGRYEGKLDALYEVQPQDDNSLEVGSFPSLSRVPGFWSHFGPHTPSLATIQRRHIFSENSQSLSHFAGSSLWAENRCQDIAFDCCLFEKGHVPQKKPQPCHRSNGKGIPDPFFPFFNSISPSSQTLK